MSDFQYICDYYKVPACYGREITIDGRAGVIVETSGPHLGVVFDDLPPSRVNFCHPTWKAEYGGIRQPRKLTRSQRRYKEWMRSESSLSFAEWIGAKR